MSRRIPIFPTLLVLAAVVVMIALGFWQLGRMHQKEALLARYAAGRALSSAVPFPRDRAAAEPVLYRHSQLDCLQVLELTSMAGRNARGEAGVAQMARCRTDGGGEALVALGWSRDPHPRVWHGGPVIGTIAPGPRLIAHPPLAGLEANAVPDPGEIPNNHLSYAVQWFFFAATALVIYALALRKRFKV